ncbi:MAG: PAS domain-containing protein [Candidatus Eisenbacteria bacterium]|uniref:histidine kinase n=1 Tax=Eiseniibacteriota bacterium TaxID=2212470 RepID=A0A956NAS8_UNCEI|nr:PAS domain-containing protein [Candidatus Eisenbacteria bacterium]MCB9463008.1 PAS domain-containing protein [Candidatus Eisenbacteria bacterium]
MSESTLAKSSEQLAVHLLDSLDFGMIALDREHRILHANRKGLEILDTSSTSLVGREIADVLLSRTPGFSLWPDAQLLAPGEFQEVMLEFEGRELILQLRWLEVAPGEREIHAILAFDDVTETMGEIEFQRTVDRFSSVGELSAVIAHEIRNPLTGIRTTIQYVASKLEDKSQLRSDLGDSITELDRIEQFTTDLLQFARPKSMQLEEDDLSPILSKVLDNLDQSFKAAGITVKRELADSLPAIPIDPDAIQQVFLNIVLNAIEAMPTGGQFRVSTSSRRYRSRQAVEVAFHDTGCGIPEEVFDKVFDPFFTTRPNGTGLGLSISLQIIKEHGGRINMRNRAGGGATFRLSFPVPVPSDGDRRS